MTCKLQDLFQEEWETGSGRSANTKCKYSRRCKHKLYEVTFLSNSEVTRKWGACPWRFILLGYCFLFYFASFCWKIMRDKITLERLSISGPACKELRSHHSILIISKKTEQIEKSNFLRFIIEVRSQSKLLPPKLGGGCRESQLTWTETTSTNLRGSQCQGRKTWSVIGKLLEAQYEHGWELKTPGDPVTGELPYLSFTS